MPPKPDFRAILEMAREQQRTYDWLVAANSYQQAVIVIPRTASASEIWEKIGFCYHLASRQTEDQEEFKKHTRSAVRAYKKAALLLKEDTKLESQASSLRLGALAEYIASWVASNPSKKKEFLSKSCELAESSLNAYKSVGNEFEYGRTSVDTLMCFFERLHVASDSQEMKRVCEEAIGCADEAVIILSKYKDQGELLRAYSFASLLGWYVANFAEMEERHQKEVIQRTMNYSGKALELSKHLDSPYCTALSNWAASLCTLLFTEKPELAQKYAREMLGHSIKVKDNYLKGIAFYLLAFTTDWMMVRETDPDRLKEGYKRIINYSEEGIRCLQRVAQDFFIAGAYMFYAESYYNLKDFETDPKERSILLQKAVAIGRKGLEHAYCSGSPDAIGSTLHALSKALHSVSNIEDRRDEKTRLLQEALNCRNEFEKIVQKAFPSNDWLSGVNKDYQGLIGRDLANIEPDQDKKRLLLERAIHDMEDGISHCKKWLTSRQIPTQIAILGSFANTYGTTLNELYFLTKDKTYLRKAIEAHKDAAEQFKKAMLPSQVAECCWKIARDWDRLGEYHKAAENFEDAQTEYKTAAQNTPNFADFYNDHASYMKAWSEIEKAIMAHEQEDYGQAMKHYQTTANLLKQTKSWRYLSPSFFGWSLLEQAEDLSRKENSKQSIEVFEKAAENFKEAKEACEKEIDNIHNADEKEMAIELSNASRRRSDYCLARVNLEEARILDQKGDHTQSAERYDLASHGFQKVLEEMETEADRKEIEPFYCMCVAWHKMKMADRAGSPELYREASELFLKAKERSTKEKTILLASGNSAFCRALENGAEFEATREREHFSKTKQYLESAADYYMKAGFEKASEWTNATEMLFDAYNYMIDAEVETGPHQKTRNYFLAEKCLERSVELYGKAGYVGKKQEVLRILDNVAEKREFALSLGELFMAPDDASNPRAISAPRLTAGEPAGLLKFEHAFLQANLILDKKEMLVGESLSLEIQLVNSGKDSAFLNSVGDIIPEGFDIIARPEKCAVDGRQLGLKGKKLAPLETDEIRMKIKPGRKGSFTFAPTIHFMDEAGGRKSCEIEPATLTVKEMGIRAWLKGQ